MAVKINGESSKGVSPGIISGTIEFPATSTWFANSDNFIYSTGGSINYNGVQVSFDFLTSARFASTPIVVATLDGGIGANGMPLTLRIHGIGPSGFTARIYNPTSASLTVGSTIRVNWIAMENSGIQV